MDILQGLFTGSEPQVQARFHCVVITLGEDAAVYDVPVTQSPLPVKYTPGIISRLL